MASQTNIFYIEVLGNFAEPPQYRLKINFSSGLQGTASGFAGDTLDCVEFALRTRN